MAAEKLPPILVVASRQNVSAAYKCRDKDGKPTQMPGNFADAVERREIRAIRRTAW
jgi:hypothetical protein